MANAKMAGDITRVQDLLEQIDHSGIADKTHAHARIWFRGHSDAAWNLRPGVYRSDFPAEDEAARLKLERHLSQDFRAMSAGLINPNAGEPELYFLQQHYRMRTRLLDWSNNALAGLYFAVASNQDKDGALFFMDAYQVGPSQKDAEGSGFQGIADSRHPVFTDALHVIFWWHTDEQFPDFLFPVRPDYLDTRIRLQRGCFTFHVPKHPELTLAENRTLTACRIPASSKEGILKEMALLGIDEFSIYGDLDHLSNRIKAAYGIPM